MNDKELLEAAAKAAGITIDPIDLEYDPKDWECWNPLRDDGDALRLAVKLKLNFSDSVLWMEHNEQKHYEPYEATRRVIVHAAAAIGQQKE